MNSILPQEMFSQASSIIIATIGATDGFSEMYEF